MRRLNILVSADRSKKRAEYATGQSDRQLPTQRGFGPFCDSSHQLNDTKCHELRLVECGVKIESVLVYSYDGVADAFVFARGRGVGRPPGATKMVPPVALSLSLMPPSTRAKI